MIPLAELTMAARLLARLPSFLRRPLGLDEARAMLRRRLERRQEDFLAVVRGAIYDHAGSPYRPLLRGAGCEYGDLERMVRRDGVEGALRVLLRSGVYLTIDEFKGRRPAVRGTATLAVDPARLRNPRSGFHVAARSGGSRGEGTPVLLDLAFIRDCAANNFLALDARGGARWVKGIWEAPGSGATFRILRYSAFGAPLARWFSPIDVKDPGLHPRYRWHARLMVWESRLIGVPLPSPELAPVADPLPIARWMAATLRGGGTPHLFSLASPAVQLCQAALDAGIDVGGAQLEMAGEPTTRARLETVRRAGVGAVPRYGSIEAGSIGYACLAPDAPDDVHLFDDLHGVVQAGDDAPSLGVPREALFVSSLRSSAPFVMLNVSMGDQAVLHRRSCGCPMEALGWDRHLHTIRSFEKLTGAGITLFDTDVVRVLEDVLPRRFGGAPTHYQLVEEEAEGGRPRVRLLVHPDVGPVDPAALVEAFLAAIGEGAGGNRMMSRIWRDADVLRVERAVPLATRFGKVHHLMIERGTDIPGDAPRAAATDS
jgi:hypothetical protein